MKYLLIASVLLSLVSQAFAFVAPDFISCKSTTKGQGNMECQYQIQGVTAAGPVNQILYVQTSMPYALCSKASCTVDSKDKTKASCQCPIYMLRWEGLSAGPQEYKNSAPKNTKGKLTNVVANFSLANQEKLTTKPTKCTGDYAACTGVMCSVSYVTKKHHSIQPEATCSCPIVKKSAYETFGASSSSDCSQGDKLWTGDTPLSMRTNIRVIQEAYSRFFGK